MARWTRALRTVAAACALAIAAGCAPRRTAEELGLPTVDIVVSDENEGQLYMGGKEQAFVPAKLRDASARALHGQVSISGQASLTYLKHSYTFESFEDPAVTIKFSAQQQDASVLRTLIGADVLREAGFLVPDVEPVALSINGQFLGLFLRIEGITEHFFERRGYEPRRSYRSKLLKGDFGVTMISDPESGVRIAIGEFHHGEVQRLAKWANSPLDSPVEPALGNAPEYFATQLFLGNCDGLNNNYYFSRKDDEAGFVFSPWDWEKTWSAVCGVSDLQLKNRLLQRSIEDPVVRHRVIAKLQDLSDRFPPSRIDALADAYWSRIEKAWNADRSFAGAGYDSGFERSKFKAIMADWHSQIATILPTYSQGTKVAQPDGNGRRAHGTARHLR